MKRRSFLQAVLGGTAVVILPDSTFAIHPIVESSTPTPLPASAEIITTATPPDDTPYWYLIGVEYADGARETFHVSGTRPEVVIDPVTFAPIHRARAFIDSTTLYQSTLIVNLTLKHVIKSRAVYSAAFLAGWDGVVEVAAPRHKRTTPVTKQYYVEGYSPISFLENS